MTDPKQIRETVDRAYAALNDPKLVADFKAAMNRSGVGDDPAVIETFHRLAQSAEAAKAPSPKEARPSLAKALYPRHP